MKKLIFSAIAMIAFVGSSMANTLEVEKEILLVEKTCEEKAMDYLEARDPNNVMTNLQLIEIYQAFMSGCGKSTKATVSQSIQP